MPRPSRRKLTIADFDHLEIDADRNLYWRGERVRSQLAFTRFQYFATAVAIIAGLGSLATGLNNAAGFACARGWTFPLGGCPVQEASTKP